MSLNGSYPVKVSAIKDLETLSRDTIKILSHAKIFSFAAYKALQSASMGPEILLEILKSMSLAVTDAMSIVTTQTLRLQQLRWEAAIDLAPKGFLTDETKRKLRLSSFTSKLLFDGQVASIYKENTDENQQLLIRNAVSYQGKPNPSSSFTTVLVSTDNTTVVAYIRHQGGTHSTELSEEMWSVLNLCFNHNIQLLVKHLPGRFNTLADRMSRVDKPISTEWSLNQEIANKIFQIMDFPSIDLFATRLNHRLPFYVSPIPDQKALSIDALSMDWNRIHAYAFPPFHLIPAVINKIRLSQCKIVLIAPLWPDRPWFPELLSLLVSPPVSLPVIPNLLAQLKGRILHQNPGHLQLHALELSNNHFEIDNFQAMLRSTSPKLEGN